VLAQSRHQEVVIEIVEGSGRRLPLAMMFRRP